MRLAIPKQLLLSNKKKSVARYNFTSLRCVSKPAKGATYARRLPSGVLHRLTTVTNFDAPIETKTTGMTRVNQPKAKQIRLIVSM